MLIAAAALLWGATSCGDDDRQEPSPAAREAAIYAAVVAEAAAVPGPSEERPVVFVGPLEPVYPIGLEVQVAVVDTLAERADVRFVDEPAQATQDGTTFIGDGVLVLVGPIPDGDRVTVATEVYRSPDAGRPGSVTVAEAGGTWTVVGG